MAGRVPSLAKVDSPELQPASSTSARIDEDKLRLRRNNQTSHTQPAAESSVPDIEKRTLGDSTKSDAVSRKQADCESIQPYLSSSAFLLYTTLHITAVIAVYCGTDIVAHFSSASFMMFIVYLSTKLCNLEARNNASRASLGLWIHMTSLVALWLFLFTAFGFTFVRDFSVVTKSLPLHLQFSITVLYFFTFRHRYLVLCGRAIQSPGTNHHTGNGFRLYFAGSGGHTGELLQMLTTSPPTDNIHRTWVICRGDETSRQKILAWEDERKSGKSLVSGNEIVMIRRAREVHQPWTTVPISSIRCAYDIYKVLTQGYPYQGPRGNGRDSLDGSMPEMRYPQVIVTNGPGTGLIIAGVAWLMKIFWLLPASSCKVLFIESIARVETLSLTGKLFYYSGIPSRMVVQHKKVGERYGLQVEEMLTARRLGDSNGDLFASFDGVH